MSGWNKVEQPSTATVIACREARLATVTSFGGVGATTRSAHAVLVGARLATATPFGGVGTATQSDLALSVCV